MNFNFKLIFFLLLIFTMLCMVGDTECVQQEAKCFKTECAVWGCREIEVDINSSSCENKREVCTGWYF